MAMLLCLQVPTKITFLTTIIFFRRQRCPGRPQHQAMVRRAFRRRTCAAPPCSAAQASPAQISVAARPVRADRRRRTRCSVKYIVHFVGEQDYRRNMLFTVLQLRQELFNLLGYIFSDNTFCRFRGSGR